MPDAPTQADVERLAAFIERELTTPANYDFEGMGHKVLEERDRELGTSLCRKLREGRPVEFEEVKAGKNALYAAYRPLPVQPTLLERLRDRDKRRLNSEVSDLFEVLDGYAKAQPRLEPLEVAPAEVSAQAPGPSHDLER